MSLLLLFTGPAGPFAGTASISTSATGTMSVARSLVGSTGETFSTSGDIITTRIFGGISQITFAVTGNLTGSYGLIGTTGLTLSTNASLAPNALTNLAGTTRMSFSTTAGPMNAAFALVGTTGVTFDTMGYTLLFPGITPRWTFSDGVSTYVFPVNPNAGGSPRLTKQFYKTAPSAPQDPGFVIRMEGRPQAPVGSIQGVLLSSDQWLSLFTWWRNHVVIEITDDLGRRFFVAFNNLKLTPAPLRSSPWRSTFTLDYTLLSPAVI